MNMIFVLCCVGICAMVGLFIYKTWVLKPAQPHLKQSSAVVKLSRRATPAPTIPKPSSSNAATKTSEPHRKRDSMSEVLKPTQKRPSLEHRGRGGGMRG
jgi:hypothetical protein